MLGCWRLRGGERLAPEAVHERLVVGEVLGQQLHRHRPLEHGVLGHEDRRHAAGAEAALDHVAAGDLGGRAHLAFSFFSLAAPGRTPPPLPCRSGGIAPPLLPSPSFGSGSSSRRVVRVGRRGVVSVVSGVRLGGRRLRRCRLRLSGLVRLQVLALALDQVPEVVEALLERVADVRVHGVRERVQDVATASSLASCASRMSLHAPSLPLSRRPSDYVELVLELRRLRRRDRLAALVIGAAAGRRQAGAEREQRGICA